MGDWLIGDCCPQKELRQLHFVIKSKMNVDTDNSRDIGFQVLPMMNIVMQYMQTRPGKSLPHTTVIQSDIVSGKRLGDGRCMTVIERLKLTLWIAKAKKKLLIITRVMHSLA